MPYSPCSKYPAPDMVWACGCVYVDRGSVGCMSTQAVQVQKAPLTHYISYSAKRARSSGRHQAFVQRAARHMSGEESLAVNSPNRERTPKDKVASLK